jgi:hypothetical protein
MKRERLSSTSDEDDLRRKENEAATTLYLSLLHTISAAFG